MVLVYFNRRKIFYGARKGAFEDFQTPLVDNGNENTEGKNEGFSLKDKEDRCKSHPICIFLKENFSNLNRTSSFDPRRNILLHVLLLLLFAFSN